MSTIVTRAGKGSALTHVEVDANFTNLNTDKIQSGNTVAALTITSATINGGTITGITDLAVADGGTGLSTLTAGYIPFGAGTSAFGSSANLFWDNTNNRLGIGTASPTITLDVRSAAASGANADVAYFMNPVNNVLASAATIKIGATTVTTRYAYIQSLISSGVNGHSLVFGTNANGATPTEKMRIDTAGNVGIGTTSPSNTLDVQSTNAYGQLKITKLSGGADNYVRLNLNNSTAAYFQIAANPSVTDASSILNIYTSGAGSNIMSLLGNGNVGINNSSPGAKLVIGQSSSTAYSLIAQTPTVGLTTGDYVNMAYFTNGRSTNNDGLRIVNLRDSTGSSIGDWSTESYRIRRSVDQNDGASGVQEEIVFGNTLLAFNTNGSERMRIDSSGNVGIGVTPSAWNSRGKAIQLGNGSINTSLFSLNSGLNGLANNTYVAASTDNYIATGEASRYYQYAGTHVWDTATSGTAGNAITFTERMRIDSSGNVGIGVTPSAWNSRGKAIQLGNGSINTSLFSLNSGLNGLANNTYVAASTDNYIATGEASRYYQYAGTHVWDTATSGTAGNAITFTERMRIDSSGNVGIGNTGSGIYKLYVTGSIGATGSLTIGTGGTVVAGSIYSDANWGMLFQAKQASPSQADFAWLNSAGTERMRIDSSGNVGIGTTSPNASAILDVQSTTKGVRMPNMTTTQKNAISSPAAGLIVFDTTLAKLCVYSGSAWQTITSV